MLISKCALELARNRVQVSTIKLNHFASLTSLMLHFEVDSFTEE